MMKVEARRLFECSLNREFNDAWMGKKCRTGPTDHRETAGFLLRTADERKLRYYRREPRHGSSCVEDGGPLG